MQNPLEIVGCSERYQNQYQIDPRERFVTFSNAKSSRNCCALRTIETIQKQMQNRLGRARRAISLRFPTQNRLDISVCPETIQKLIQKRPGRAMRLRFPMQNRVELAVCSKTIPKPIQNRPTWTIRYVFQYKIVSKSLCARNDTKINTKSTHVNDPLRFPIRNRLEIAVRPERSKRFKNKCKIDLGERGERLAYVFQRKIVSTSLCAPKRYKNQYKNDLGERFVYVFQFKIVSNSLCAPKRYQNQYRIDPGERFVTFSNTKSSGNPCALGTIQKSILSRGWEKTNKEDEDEAWLS